MNLFTVIGINFKSADFHARNEYALNPDQQDKLLDIYKQHGYESTLILSTCNRTEVFTFGNSSEEILTIWLRFLGKESLANENLFYVHQSVHALRHLATVTSGAASQIPGDYEIVSQVKKAVIRSQKKQMLNGRMEKIFNTAIRVSKRVKTETNFSTGTSSVSYAVAQKISKVYQPNEKVLVIGSGKMGSACVKHLSTLIPASSITISNRSFDKALNLAKLLNIHAIRLEEISGELVFDHIVLATQAQNDILFTHHFSAVRQYHLYDLTMPSNVQDDVAFLEQVHLQNIDQISTTVNQNMERRLADLPLVNDIIESELIEIGKWWQIKQVISKNDPEEELQKKIKKIRGMNISAESLFQEVVA